MITEVFFVSQYGQKHGRDIGPVEEDKEMRMSVLAEMHIRSEFPPETSGV